MTNDDVDDLPLLRRDHPGAPDPTSEILNTVDTPAHDASDEDTDIRTRSLKERIYATFTGLAILSAVMVTGHATAWEVFFTVLIGVFGISAAGFLAEIVAHQVSYKRMPQAAEVTVMARIALSALGSASAPLIVLAASGLGLFDVDIALRLGMALYAAVLVAIFLVASHRSGLRPLQKLISSAMLAGIALLIVAVLSLAHLH